MLSPSSTACPPFPPLLPPSPCARIRMQCSSRGCSHVTRRLATRRPATRRPATRRHGLAQIHQRLISSRPTIPIPPPPNARPAGAPSHTKSRALPWTLSSIAAAAVAFYGAQIYMAAQRPCTDPAALGLSTQKDVSSRYEDTAASFDSDVGMSEIIMGINGTRKRLSSMAKGHVLEVSCGTGRNVGYYDVYARGNYWFSGARTGNEGAVESLTFVDLSPGMVDVCKKKWNALVGSKGQERLRKGLVVRFLPASALEEMPPAPGGASGRYGTIIQTMGLCSTPQPVELLTNMARHLDMADPDARILLLEHGRSYQQWLNNILDNSAAKHAEIHGCWFNRDIGALVEEAADKSGLEVVREKRWHLGTTWLFELKPKPETVEAARRASNGPDERREMEARPKPVKGGWFGSWSSQ